MSVYGLTHCHCHFLCFWDYYLLKCILFACKVKEKYKRVTLQTITWACFMLFGVERGKENNRCEDQNILNSPGVNTVSVSSKRAVLTLP